MDSRHPRLLFTLEEAAEMLDLSRTKLYELVKKGLVPHRRITGAAGTKFTQADIDQILADAHRPAVA